MAADVTKSIVHLAEDLFLTGTVKDFIHVRGVASTNPADFTAVANASALTTATVTATGAAVGDVVIGWGVVSGLATNQYVVAAYVSGANEVTLVIGNALNSTVTTTAVTVSRLSMIMAAQWPRLASHVDLVVAAVDAAVPGGYTEVEIPTALL